MNELTNLPEEQELTAQTQAADETAQMPAEDSVTVAVIRFRNNAKNYFFDPGQLQIKAGDHVIMDTSRGVEFGYCTGGNQQVAASEIVPPLRKILRIATEQDERINNENLERERKAFEVCMQKIIDHKLDMQLVSAECAFDGSKILFFFTADGRVDFRELVKDLAAVFRTRIELRQIGVRDKAKMVGGLGMCGRPFCCREFLDDFQPVSIKMAKTQNLSLNPTKISGVCGRLMCCLKYEQDAYEDLLRTAPKNESFVDTPDGRGTVTEVNLLRQSVKVRMEDSPETIGCYKNCDICVLRSGKAKKNDPPIPKDVAPISSQSRPAAKETVMLDAMPEVRFSDGSAVAASASAQEGEKTPRSRHRRRGRGNGAKQNADGASGTAQQTRAAQEKPRNEQRTSKPAQEHPAAEAKPAAEKTGEQSHNRRRRYRRRGGHGGGQKAES